MERSAERARPSETAQRLSDEEVVDRVIGGDAASFEILMRRNNPRVYRAIRSVLRDETEVEDAMQATYLAAFAKLDTFERHARFSTWLTRIALNEAFGRLRQRRRHPVVSLGSAAEPEQGASEAAHESPEAAASRHELAAFLEAAVDALPEIYRVVFMLREVDGLDTSETAAVLDVTEDVVKTRLFRARATLRERLERAAGTAVADAFGFHAVRCDRVVHAVLARIAPGPALDLAAPRVDEAPARKAT